MDIKFFKEALFLGKTANAFKLGTALTLGKFWSRTSGCCLLYRGESIEQTDFDNILICAEFNVEQIQPPGYVRHNENCVCFYLVRKINGSGYEEYTLSASVKVAVDNNGNLVLPRPNSISNIKSEQVADNKIQLQWYYCPLNQQSQPVCFNIYCDSGSGQIDYENPVAVMQYIGRKFYRYISNTLQSGKYLFAIKAEDVDGTESNKIQMSVEVNSVCPDTVEIGDIRII